MHLQALTQHTEKAVRAGEKKLREKKNKKSSQQFTQLEFRCYRCVVIRIHLIL